MPRKMTKSDRKRVILRFLVESEMMLTPKAIHLNIPNTTWTRETTRRLLDEMATDGLVKRVPEKTGYYRATGAGRRQIESNG